MRRREFLGLVGGAAAYPLAARAQQPNRPVVAVLSPVSAIAFARNLNALRAGFRDLDYTEGRNLSIEIRYAGGAVAQLPSLAAELLASIRMRSWPARSPPSLPPIASHGPFRW
jgi:putative tryptophan/tyrosine transport system substrate-binding protein